MDDGLRAAVPAPSAGSVARRASARGSRGRWGQSAVEFALVLPAFMLLIAGMVEFGRAFFAYEQLYLAAQEGARYGAVFQHYRDDASIIARVREVAPGGTADSVTVSSTAGPQDSTSVAAGSRTRGNVLTVTAQHAQSVLVPFFPLPSMTLNVSVSMVIE